MWKEIEIKGYGVYAEQGYRILVSLVDNSDYDFVAEKDGIYTKVNVKLAGYNSGRWRVRGDGDRFSINGCDEFLVWHPEDERWYIFPSKYFTDRSCGHIYKEDLSDDSPFLYNPPARETE